METLLSFILFMVLVVFQSLSQDFALSMVELTCLKVSGIRSGTEEAKAPLIICDPSYVKDLKKVKENGKIIRAICILDHPIPNTNDSASC